MKYRILCIAAWLFCACLYCKLNFNPPQEKTVDFIAPYSVTLMESNGEKESLHENELNAIGACLMDAQNGRVLYGKASDKILAMASTTKIMTCLIALEHCNQNEIVTVSKYAASQPPVQMNIQEGEKYYLKDLLHSMMMESHNDSAVAVAEHVAGSEEAFCKLMTEKAKELGAKNTVFGSANGLDKGEHHTTPEDLALIASYAIRNDAFLAIVGCDTYTVHEIDGERSVFLANIDKYLYMDSNAIGIKTGFTNKAGYCFVGATRYEDTVLISVVLGSGWPPNKSFKWNDTKTLVAYGKEHFHRNELGLSKEILGAVVVENGQSDYVEIVPQYEWKDSFLLGNESVTVEYHFNECYQAPIESGEILGYERVMIEDEMYCEIPIVAIADVDVLDYNYYINRLSESLW